MPSPSANAEACRRRSASPEPRVVKSLGTTVFGGLASTIIGLILGAIAAVLALVGLWTPTYRVYGTPVIAIPWTLPDGADVEVAS